LAGCTVNKGAFGIMAVPGTDGVPNGCFSDQIIGGQEANALQAIHVSKSGMNDHASRIAPGTVGNARNAADVGHVDLTRVLSALIIAARHKGKCGHKQQANQPN